MVFSLILPWVLKYPVGPWSHDTLLEQWVLNYPVSHQSHTTLFEQWILKYPDHHWSHTHVIIVSSFFVLLSWEDVDLPEIS